MSTKKEREKKHINKKIQEIEYETLNQSFEPNCEAFSCINKIFESRENFKKEYGPPNRDPTEIENYISFIQYDLIDLNSDADKKWLRIGGDIGLQILKKLPQIPNAEKIQRIYLTGYKIKKPEDDPFFLLSKCKNLRLQELNVGIDDFSISEFGLYFRSFRNIKYLEKLNIAFQDDKTYSEKFKVLESSSENLTSLKSLIIGGVLCDWTSILDFLLALKKSNIIIKLNLRFDRTTTGITDENLKNYIAPEHKLEKFISYFNINDEKLIALFKNFDLSELKEINLNRNSELKGPFLENLSRQENFKNLTSFSCSRCDNLNLDTLENFVKSKKCENLEILEIRSFLGKIPIKVFLEILSSKPNLKNLNLACLDMLKTQDWLSVFSSKNLQNVKWLSVYSSAEFTLEALRKISEACPKVEYLDLDNNRLTDEAFEILTKFENLKTVDLSHEKFTFEEKWRNFLASDCFKKLENIHFNGLDKNKFLSQLINFDGGDLNLIYMGLDYNSKDVVEMIKKPHFQKFDFRDILNRFKVGNSILDALIKNGHHLKKIWSINEVVNDNKNNENEKINGETLKRFVSSENLNPFFEKNDFIQKVKEEVTDEILKAMSENAVFMRFLLSLNLRDCKIEKTEGVCALLNSKYISPYFDVSGLLQSVPIKMDKRESILENLDRFTLLKKLDISGYSLKKMEKENHRFFAFFDKSKFPNLRDLNLSNTELDKKLLEKLFPNNSESILKNLLYLSLAFNPEISSESFQDLFKRFNEEIKLMGLDLDGCAIINEDLEELKNSKISMNIEFLSINKCSSINHFGLQYLLDWHNDESKKLRFMNIYQDYKGLINLDIKNKKFIIYKPKYVDLYKIQKVLVNKLEQKDPPLTPANKRRLINLRYAVTDGLLKEFLQKENRINIFKTLDFSKCPISSAGLKAIAEAKELTNLVCLKLNNTFIDDEGICNICKITGLKFLEIDGCREITQKSLKYILEAKKFHIDFNPEKILREYNHLIDLDLVDSIAKSIYRKNIKVLYLKNNDNLKIKCLDKKLDLDRLLDLEKENKNMELELNIEAILSENKSEIDDELLIKLSKSKILANIKEMTLDQPQEDKNEKAEVSNKKIVTKVGLNELIKSEYLQEDFNLGVLLENAINLIDDDVLKAISKSKCFAHFQYKTYLKDCNKSKIEEENKEKDPKEEKKEENENEEKPKNLELEKRKITAEGLWHLSLCPNEKFEIQNLINDFGEMITSSFIKNMVQQPYFKKLKESLDLSQCTQLKDDDLCLIIKSSNENFNLEKFILVQCLPKKEASLVTNNVVKAISKSAYIKSRYYKASKSSCFGENDFKRFVFDVKNYPKVDYAINYLIQAHASQIRHYAVYLETYSAYLSSKSLENMRNDIINYKKFNQAMIKKKQGQKELDRETSKAYNDEEKIVEALSGIKTLKFSTNKYIYDPNIKASLSEAFENFQNQNDLNLDGETVKYYVKEISRLQFKNNSPDSFDQKHETLLDLIKECKNLEKINLDNLNLGDDFLKKFSIYISENNEYLRNLKEFEIKNNHRITSVGLKYLYCSIISRTAVLQTITVQNEGAIKKQSDINAFVSTGLKGMIDTNIERNSRELRDIFSNCLQEHLFEDDDDDVGLTENEELGEENKEEDKLSKKDDEERSEEMNINEDPNENKQVVLDIKGPITSKTLIIKKDLREIAKRKCSKRFKAFLKFLMIPRTMEILAIYFLVFPVLMFHYLEKFIFLIPKAMSSCVACLKKRKPFKLIMIPFIGCWRCFEKFYDCFGNCFKITGFKSRTEKKNEIKKAMEEKKEQERKLKEEEEKRKIEEEEEKKAENKEEEDKVNEGKKDSKIKAMNELGIDIPRLSKNKIVPDKNDQNLPSTPATTISQVTNKEKSGFCYELRKNPKVVFSFLSCIKIQSDGAQPFTEELRKRYSRCQRVILEEIQREAKVAKNLKNDSLANNNQEPASPEKNPNQKENINIGEPISPERILNKDNKESKKASMNLSAYFYFDESLIRLNDVLYGSQSLKNQKKKPLSAKVLGEGGKSDESETLLHPLESPLYNSGAQLDVIQNESLLNNHFFMISKMKWIILMDFIVFYILVIFYLLYMKLEFKKNADIYVQIPYFVYGFLSFLFEIALCWEVTSIINNDQLVSISDATIFSNLITSQTAKYDTFTNISFVLGNLAYNSQKNEFEAGSIFIASLIFVGFNILLNFKNFFTFFWKNFVLPNRQNKRDARGNKYHSSENINRFSKLCFQFEFQSLGRLLDKFSTNSAKKYDYWFLPKMLHNVYIPTIITATFGRLLLEDFPLLIIQLYVAVNTTIFDFTYVSSLCSTILALFMTLHTAWNVKPSIFNRELFEKYLKQTIDVKNEMLKKNQNDENGFGEKKEEEKNGKIEVVEKELAKEEKKKAEARFNPKILLIQKETIPERGEKENDDRNKNK